MNKIILIGLPSSGKSTFLAALWYLVEGKHKTAFTLEQLDGDREFLNNIRDRWLSCNSVDRTRRTNEQVAFMRLKNTETNQTVDLNIPDLSGETFLDQWVNRNWSRDFHKTMSEADGAFLFIHPNEVVEPTRIDQADVIKNGISEKESYSDQKEYQEVQEWDLKLAPTQVQLTELLQFIEVANCVKLPFKLAVIISAWDLVSALGDSPTSWLNKRLPLLSQYLTTNNTLYPSKVYGISAQGGDYEKDENRLAGYANPQERILIVDADNKLNDLSIPLRWLISEEHDK